MKMVLGRVFKNYQLQSTPEVPKEVSEVITRWNTSSYSYFPRWYFGSKSKDTETSYLVVCECNAKELRELKLMNVIISENSFSFKILSLTKLLYQLFYAAMKSSELSKYTPLAFMGYVPTKNGKNYHLLCQLKIKDKIFVSIVVISEKGKLISTNRLGDLGYAFTW